MGDDRLVGRLLDVYAGVARYDRVTRKGVRNHSERAKCRGNRDRRRCAKRAPKQMPTAFLNARFNRGRGERIPQLLQYAMQAGESLFGDNCATCHGCRRAGIPSRLSEPRRRFLALGRHRSRDIQQTLHLRHPLRSPEQTRFNMMQAFGKRRGNLLSNEQINDLVEHVVQHFWARCASE